MRYMSSRSFPEVAVERDSDSEESSSEDESTRKEDTELRSGPSQISSNGVFHHTTKKEKDPITLSFKKVCKVCKRSGHEAGFRGATYFDCPMKPCFLCRKPGHTTMSCPHRVSTGVGIAPATYRTKSNRAECIFERQLRFAGIRPVFTVPDRVSRAVIRYHSRRVTCLEFHPSDGDVLLSGDKKGHIGVWNFKKVHEKTTYENIHTCILNNIRFNPKNAGTIYTCSSDGTLSYSDLDTGSVLSSVNLNPGGWEGPSTWKMLYGMDVHSRRDLVLAGDNFGFLHMTDFRCSSGIREPVLIHKIGTKVVGIHCNPMDPDIFLTCGNDHFARIFDMRHLISGGTPVCSLQHDRVVNSAYFSPRSGTKILTTSQDNRLRVWDSIFRDLESPTREIVHSHDFNRHLTPFRAEWDPKDPTESIVVVGRYISDNFNGVALHPIDLIDVGTGRLVAELVDPNITTISSVNKFHPREDIIASGSSRFEIRC